MCNCRKCGAKQVTRRAAGVFFCQHCGMQPGSVGFDRAGNLPPSPPVTQDGIPAPATTQ